MGNIRGGMNGFLGTIGQPTAQVIDSSLKFKGGQYLERTSTAGNQTTWTWSGWIKTSDLSGNNIFGEDGGYPNASASFNSSGVLRFTAAAADSSVFLNIIPSALFRDLSAWYHFVIVYDSGQSTSSERAKIYVNGSRLTDLSTATYPSQNATTVVNSNGNAFRIGSHSGVDHLQGYMSQCYFIDGLVLGPGYFGFTDPLTNTWRPRKFRAVGTTINDGTVWSSLASVSSGSFQGSFPATNGFNGTLTSSDRANGDTNGSSIDLDFSGKNIIVKNDIAIWSGKSSMRYSINGGEYVSYSDATEKWKTILFSGRLLSLKIKHGSDSEQPGFSGLAVDGVTMLDSTTTNLDFGTNGFYLPMDNQDDFEVDKSGKGNDYTKVNFSGTSINPDVVKDSPSGAVFGGRAQTGITTTSSAPANYCTFNPLDKYSGITLSTGNLTLDHSSGSTIPMCRSTIGMSSGKFYFEVTRGSGTYGTMGIATADSDLSMYAGRSSNAVGGYEIYTENTEKWAGGSGGSQSGYLTVAWDSDGDVASCYFDADKGTIGFMVNGTDMGIAFTGIDTTKTYFFQCGSQGTILHANFGQKPFKYAPPQGYLPLNSASVTPETVIARPDQYVGVTTYSGNTDTSRQIISGMQPDLVWLKNRDDATVHGIYDSVRGIRKRLSSDGDGGEQTDNGVLSFNSNGFNVGQVGLSNEDGSDYVAWSWKAGGNKNTFNVDNVGYSTYTDAPGLDEGTIKINAASVGTKQGFSIIKYRGTGGSKTIPHGLSNKVPKFIIIILVMHIEWLLTLVNKHQLQPGIAQLLQLPYFLSGLLTYLTKMDRIT